MISQIAEEFNIAPSQAMHEDVLLCQRIMAMRRYSSLRSHEDAGHKLTGRQMGWLKQMEEAAGV